MKRALLVLSTVVLVAAAPPDDLKTRAARIHRSAIVVDTHQDVPYRLGAERRYDPQAMTLPTLDLLQSSPQPGGAGGLIQFLPMIFIFVVFYFLLIAPMRKKQKRQQQMLSQLKRGDEVVTASGILGRIAALDDANGIVVLQIAENVKIKVLRNSIAGPAGGAEATAAPAAT